uniref:G protein-coupled receptor n=1 Tax=Globodera rostochiensis TaxID=31243 RepID=A0A914IA13_GLORO
MELLFFNPDEYERLYNYSAYEIDQVPLSKRQNIPLGVAFLSISIICEAFPPIIYLLFNKTVRRDVLVMFVRPIGMVFPCITLPSGGNPSIIRTLETNCVTATSKSIRTIMSQANRMKPLATIEPCALKWIQ